MYITLWILLASLAVILTGLTWLAITEPCDPTSHTIWCGSELTRMSTTEPEYFGLSDAEVLSLPWGEMSAVVLGVLWVMVVLWVVRQARAGKVNTPAQRPACTIFQTPVGQDPLIRKDGR